MESIFSIDFCKIDFDTSTGILYAEWSGFLKLDEVKEGCGVLTDFVRKNHVVNHLSDHRNLRVLSNDVQNYLTTLWFPEVERIGLRKVAVLVSPDMFAKVSVAKVNREAQVGELKIDTFKTQINCENWLLNQEQVEV